MKPDEKAEELVELFYKTIVSYLGESMKQINATKCAIEHVKQIIKYRPTFPMNYDELGQPINQLDWWRQVEQSLLKKLE